jgi:hypothetical protein
MQSEAELLRERFEDWLFVMDDELEAFVRSFPDEMSQQLNYSPESLGVLESWMLKTYSSPKHLSEDKMTWDKIGRYIGETYRKTLGGRWDVQLNSPEMAYYGLPVIIAPNLSPDCPLSFSTAALDRKRQNYLQSVLTNLKQIQSKAQQ